MFLSTAGRPGLRDWRFAPPQDEATKYRSACYFFCAGGVSSSAASATMSFGVAKASASIL